MNKLKIIAFSTLLALLPLPALSTAVEIYRVTIKENTVTLRVKVLDDERVPIAGLNKNDFKITTTNAQGNSVRLNPSQITLLSSEH